MGKRLTYDERKQIKELDEKGLSSTEIATIVARQIRTVNHYLEKLPRIQSAEREKQRRWDAHSRVIRRRITSLKENLEFPSPMLLWIPDDPKTGKPVTILGLFGLGDHIEWEVVDGNYIVKLNTKFDLVIQHLGSSRRQASLAKLDEWKRVSGKCIKDCYKIRLFIEKEAKERTQLKLGLDTSQRGLLDGFSQSVYWATFCDETAIQYDYKIVSKQGDLCLLNFASFNLAWLHEYETDRVKDIHQKLIGAVRKLSITSEFRKSLTEVNHAVLSLQVRLDDFASLEVLPGKCGSCPM